MRGLYFISILRFNNLNFVYTQSILTYHRCFCCLQLLKIFFLDKNLELNCENCRPFIFYLINSASKNLIRFLTIKLQQGPRHRSLPSEFLEGRPKSVNGTGIQSIVYEHWSAKRKFVKVFTQRLKQLHIRALRI